MSFAYTVTSRPSVFAQSRLAAMAAAVPGVREASLCQKATKEVSPGSTTVLSFMIGTKEY